MNEVLARLAETGQIPREVAEKLGLLKPGTYCLSKTWGVGKVKAWDIPADTIEIDFENKGEHPMKLAFACKTLEALESDHFLARWLDNSDAIRKLAADDPADLMRNILRSHGGSMHVEQLEMILVGRLLKPGQFKAWWETNRKKLKEDKRLIIPARRTDPIVLRDESKTPAESMVDDLVSANDLRVKSKALNSIIAGGAEFPKDGESLKPVLEDLDKIVRRYLKIQLPASLELVLLRDELISQRDATEGYTTEGHVTMVEIARLAQGNLPEVTQALSIGGMRRVYEAFPEAYGDAWVGEAFRHMATAGPRRIVEITRVLADQNKTDELNAFLADGIQQRTLSGDMLCWIVRERKGMAEKVFGPEVGPVILNSVETEHYSDNRKNNRLRDLFVNDRDLIIDLLKGAEMHDVRNLARRLRITPAYEQLTRNSLMARIIREYPVAEELVRDDMPKVVEKDNDTLIVSWESLEDRRKQLEEITSVKIPGNVKEIQIAKEYGDLRENFEYQAAKQMQKILQRQRDILEKELRHARPTDFSEANISQVSIGTVVDLKNSQTGETETVSLLGAWDTDPAKNIISYLSAKAIALIGHKPGEVVSIPTNTEGVTEDTEILAVRKYNNATPE